jgi:hypothetical protein
MLLKLFHVQRTAIFVEIYDVGFFSAPAGNFCAPSFLRREWQTVSLANKYDFLFSNAV